MKASAQHQRVLLDIAALDTESTQVRTRARSLPEHDRLREIHRESELARTTLAEKLSALEDVRGELKRAQSTTQLMRDRVAKNAARLESGANAKEAQALERELATLRERISGLEDTEIELMEQAEEREQTYVTAREIADNADQRMRELETERDLKLDALKAENATIVAKRTALAATVPEELMALYDRQLERGGVGAAELRFGVSLASNVTLTPDELAKIRATSADDIVYDTDSGAILVRTDHSFIRESDLETE